LRAGSDDGSRRKANQPAHQCAARDRVVTLAGLDEEIIGPARFRGEVTPGLAWKQRFAGNEFRIAIELHVASTKGHAETLTLFRKHHGARLPGLRWSAFCAIAA
jgi:hypothetical protein